MAIIQGIISLLSRSVGKIFSALFDWAVVALFGRVSGSSKIWLSALMAAAAAWPILVAGALAPRIATLVIAFVPLSGSVSANVMRAVWIALVLLVPIAVGVVLRVQTPPERRRGSWVRSVGRGFPITLGLSAAFVVLLVTVPALRIASAVRGRRDVHLPLVTTTESYERAAQITRDTLRRRGFAVEAAPVPWWSALPSKLVRSVARSGLASYVPEHTAYFRGSDLEVVLYPNALLLRGPIAETARVQAVLVEALTGRPGMLQAMSAEAQAIEEQIQRVWTIYRQQPEAHQNAWALRSRVDDIGADLARRSLEFDEWQVIYRELLQLDRALRGAPQVIERALGEDEPVPPAMGEAAGNNGSRTLSTRELMRRIGDVGSRLVAKELELARVELRADAEAELAMVKLLAVAAIGVLSGVHLLIVAALLGVARWLEAPIGALATGAVSLAVLGLAVAAALGYAGWRSRVSVPLASTRKTVTEDVQWVKERVA
jgi:uncharacterized membrane protein YqjE